MLILVRQACAYHERDPGPLLEGLGCSPKIDTWCKTVRFLCYPCTGASKEVIEAIPTVTVGKGGGGLRPDDDPRCSICLADYASGATLRKLPCGHQFHRCRPFKTVHHIVDGWLC